MTQPGQGAAAAATSRQAVKVWASSLGPGYEEVVKGLTGYQLEELRGALSRQRQASAQLDAWQQRKDDADEVVARIKGTLDGMLKARGGAS